MIVHLLLVSIILVQVKSCTMPGLCPSDWKTFGEYCDYSIEERMTFDEARRRCEELESGLVFYDERQGLTTCSMNVSNVRAIWSNWESNSTCSDSCGGGSQRFVRHCQSTVTKCCGESEKIEECNKEPCPIDGGWSDYEVVGSCSKSCGTGEQKYIRHCNNPEPEYGGNDCIGDNIKTEECNTQDCPACPSDWTRHENLCFKTSDNATSWEKAEAYCVNQGGHLLSIHSTKTLKYVANKVFDGDMKNRVYWIGFHKVDDQWTWSDNTPADYTAWDILEPSHNAEGCAVLVNYSSKIWDNRGSSWHDRMCYYHYYFICNIQVPNL